MEGLCKNSCVELKPNESIDLPVHIPDQFKAIPKYNQIKIIGVHAGNMFSRNGEKINNSYTREGYAAALNLDRKTKAVLEFYVKDKTLEGFWDKRKSIYPVLKEMDFSAVIAPNYSVYEDAPRVDHMYNIKRSMIVYNELLESGIPAVPDVSWYNKSDLDRWCGEINKNDIKVVDVGLKTTNIWRSYISGFRYLCRNIRSDVKIIVAGLVSPFRVLEIFKAACGQSLHILNQSAYVQSRRGMLSEVRMQNSGLSFDEIFERNIAAGTDICSTTYIYKYDGKKIYQYDSFKHLTGKFCYDRKGKIYYWYGEDDKREFNHFYDYKTKQTGKITDASLMKKLNEKSFD